MIFLRYPRQTKLVGALVKFIFAGNSIMIGVGSSGTPRRWPNVMMAQPILSSSGIPFVNHGVSGMSIDISAGVGTLLATRQTVIDSFDPTKINYLFMHEFINQFRANSNNVQQAIAAWIDLIARYRAGAAAKGAKLYVITMTTTPAGNDPGSNPNDGQAQARINARMAAITLCNELMRRDYRKWGADQLIDVAALPPFQAMTDLNDWTIPRFIETGLWAKSDGTADDYAHFGNPGYDLIGVGASREIPRLRELAST